VSQVTNQIFLFTSSSVGNCGRPEYYEIDMVYIVLLILALLFAVPTFGFSLLAFWLLTNFLNKIAAKPIMVAMYSSYKIGEEITLPHRDNATIRKAFQMLNVTEYEEQFYSGMGLRTFTGYVQHPMHSSRLLVQIHCQRVRGEKAYITVGSSDTSVGAKEWLNELVTKARS
jgi:hypothetical protein